MCFFFLPPLIVFAFFFCNLVILGDPPDIKKRVSRIVMKKQTTQRHQSFYTVYLHGSKDSQNRHLEKLRQWSPTALNAGLPVLRPLLSGKLLKFTGSKPLSVNCDTLFPWMERWESLCSPQQQQKCHLILAIKGGYNTICCVVTLNVSLWPFASLSLLSIPLWDPQVTWSWDLKRAHDEMSFFSPFFRGEPSNDRINRLLSCNKRVKFQVGGDLLKETLLDLRFWPGVDWDDGPGCCSFLSHVLPFSCCFFFFFGEITSSSSSSSSSEDTFLFLSLVSFFPTGGGICVSEP